MVWHESDLCQRQLVNLRRIIQEAEHNEQEERIAQAAALNKLKDDLAKHDKARLSALLGQESALLERKRLEVESATLHDDLDRALAEVESGVAAYGYMDIAPNKADELLAALTTRRNTYVQRMQAKERLETSRWNG